MLNYCIESIDFHVEWSQIQSDFDDTLNIDVRVILKQKLLIPLQNCVVSFSASDTKLNIEIQQQFFLWDFELELIQGSNGVGTYTNVNDVV